MHIEYFNPSLPFLTKTLCTIIHYILKNNQKHNKKFLRESLDHFQSYSFGHFLAFTKLLKEVQAIGYLLIQLNCHLIRQLCPQFNVVFEVIILFQWKRSKLLSQDLDAKFIQNYL